MNKTTIVFLTLLLLIPLMSAQVTLDKETYELGEHITIYVNKTGTINPGLVITHNNKLFRFSGELEEYAMFLPQNIGNYTLTLVEQTTNTQISSKEFTVQYTGEETLIELDNTKENNKTFQEQQTIESLPSNATTNRFITLHQEEYAVAENVPIIINYRAEQFTLRIISPEAVFSLIGEPQRDTLFRPRELGEYEIQLIAPEGIIETKNFRVVEQPTTTRNLPFTNIQSKIRDSQGNAFDTNRIRIHDRQGLPVQSNINAQERYKVTLLPQDPYVQQVVFDDVQFSQALDIGIETLAPKYNPAGEGTSIHAFALDPERVDFTTGTITLEAPGTQVYKCVDYDFTTQECYGEHELIMQTTPGELITIDFDAIDPLYTFVDTTITCSCTQTQSPAANTGTISCQTYCPVTIDAPGSSAVTGFIEEIQYLVGLTIVDDGATMSNGAHEGYFDQDTTQSNGNEQLIGTSAAIATTTLTWTATGLPSTGTASFNNDNCDSWPINCSNYNVFLSTSIDFAAPGKSTRSPSTTISLDTLNVTWNYTQAGDLSITLENPPNNAARNTTTIDFEYRPLSTATNITSCSLYLNDTTWQAVTNSTSITNNITNTLTHTFSGDGVYVWNVFCEDSDDNEEFSPANRTITIDTQAPVVTSIAPANLSVETNTPIVFEYNVTNNLTNINSCSLYINNTLAQTDTSITRDITQEFILAQTSGFYEWYVSCVDQAGNTGFSETRTYEVNITPTIWDGLWYESSTFDCAATGSCEIALAQATDGTPNSKAVTLTAGSATGVINATSPFLGGRGVFVPQTQTITLRAAFIATTGGQGLYTWNLYALRANGDQDLMCVESGTAATGFIEQTCSLTTNFTFSGTDRLRLETTIQNTHPSQARTYTHEWDVANSFVNIPDFYTIGTLSTVLLAPTSPQTIAVNEQINVTCEATCEYGYCLDTELFVQQRTTPSGSWSNIGATGNLVLATGQVNPEVVGDLLANPTNSTNRTFTIEGNLVSNNEVRCRATTLFDDITSNAQTIIVGDDQAPIVALVSPPDQTIHGTSPITLTYNVTNAGGLDSCSLVLNDSINQTDNTPTNNANNNFLLSGLAEGLYNWTVFCIDDGARQGNATDTWEFTIDTTAPTIQLNYPPDEATLGVNTVEFNWTLFDNNPAPGTCDLYINSSLEQSGLISIPGTSNTTTVENFAVGSYNWYMQCSDAAGNTNTSETRTFNITNTPPIIELFAPVNNAYLPSSTVVFEYNASDNNEVLGCELYLNGAFNQANQTPINQSGTNTFSVSGLSDELYNWSVSCFDDAFTTNSETRNFTVDTVAPDVTLISPILVQLTTATVNFQFNYSDITSPTGVCELDYYTGTENYTVSTIPATSNLITTQTVNNIPDGIYSWNVTCLDLASNPGTSSIEQFNISVIPTIALEAPAPNAYRNGAAVNFTFTPTDNDGFDSCTVKLLSGPNVSNTTNQTPIISGVTNTITITGLDAGAHTWAVECIDAGVFSNSFQTSARFLFIDNEAPTIDLNSPVDIVVNSANVTFNWTADDDQANTLSCDLFINGALNASTIPSAAGNPTTFWVDGFNNGPHNWTVSCIDDAGNTNTSITADFTVEVPPSATLRDPEDNQYYNFTQEFFFAYTPEANADLLYCDIYSNGALIHNNPTPSSGVEQQIFVNLTGGEGSYSWNVLCEDIDGLTGGAPNNFTYIIDLTAPTINVTAPQNNSIQSNNNVTFNITPEDNFSPNVTCDIVVDGFPEVNGVVIPTGDAYVTGILLPDGSYDWYATCTDLAGNTNTTDTYNFTVFAPPIVTLLEPLNNTFYNITSATLTYLPEDGFPIVSCDLYLNNVFNQTDSFIQTNQNNTFELTSLTEGFYDWRIECLDQDSNVGVSDTYVFAIDLSAPQVTLYNPLDFELFNIADILFNFTATDTLDNNLTCDLRVNNVIESAGIDVIDGEPYTELITGFPDGLNLWNVTCVDDAAWSNTSETRTFNISVAPNVTLITPTNNTWTNQENIGFSFNVSDNDGLDFCELQLNGITSTTNTTITNNIINTISNNTITEGTYNWTILCEDSGAYNNRFAPDNLTINVDRTAPNITLYEPANNAETGTSVLFNFSVTDNLAPTIDCQIILNGNNITYDTLTNGSFKEHTQQVSLGFYEWNVTCIDLAGNQAVSDTRNFSVILPDLTINTGNITFSEDLPTEGENITIFANIFNIGVGEAENFIVQFYEGDPDLDGVQIGNNQTVASLEGGENITLQQNFTVGIGNSNLFVSIDPDNEVPELNETNNKANRTLQVSHYEIFSGLTNDELRVDDSTLTGLYSWSVDNSTGSLLFVADSDSVIAFTNLTALSRSTTGTYDANHFTLLDTRLNSTQLPDSINNTWTQNSSPLATRDYTIFGRIVENVPIVNSTNTSSFQTGILWDSSDGSSSYDGTQEVLFVTTINQSQQGFTGTYDYEFKIPATLRDYHPGGGMVTFYAEIR